MLDPLLLPFTDELLKIAFVAKTPKMKAYQKAEKHFSSSDKNWPEFEKNLRSKHFQEAASSHPEADNKLKRYVKNYGGYLSSKETVGQIPSERTSKTYLLKKVGRRTACGCKDWQYKKSHGGGDCKHVKMLKKEKRSFVASLVHGLTTAEQAHRRAKKSLQQGQLASQAAQGATVAERQNLFQRQLQD